MLAALSALAMTAEHAHIHIEPLVCVWAGAWEWQCAMKRWFYHRQRYLRSRDGFHLICPPNTEICTIQYLGIDIVVAQTKDKMLWVDEERRTQNQFSNRERFLNVSRAASETKTEKKKNSTRALPANDCIDCVTIRVPRPLDHPTERSFHVQDSKARKKKKWRCEIHV